MKNYLLAALMLLGMALPTVGNAKSKKVEPIQDVIERGLRVATAHALNMAKTVEPGRFPVTIKDGKLKTSTYSWWCCGFYPGELWYLYENTPTEELKKYAEQFTASVEPVKNVKYSHDVGFMIYCSFGNGYRLTGNPHYKDVMETAAQSLYTRYRPQLGLIRSWDFHPKKKPWQYPVIIDNMMNLEFLMWSGQTFNDNRYREAAISHAQRTMENHFREDYSCYHVVSYDTITGKPDVKQTHQGYADYSAWSRGQAWALYGYTMMYRESGRTAFLNHAKNVAAYLMNHPRMPKDKIPYWDFDAPNIPKEPRDASAAAVMASALIELGQIVGGEQGQKYIAYAEDQVRSLTSKEYLAKEGKNCNFALMHSTGSKPGNNEIDVPLSYADYYYVEALIRLKKMYSPNKLPIVNPEGKADRKYWVETLVKIADPVLVNLSNNTLKKNMPYVSKDQNRRAFSYLEGVGRLFCGLAPWLELGPDETPEGQLRAKYINLAVKGLSNAVNPSAPDYLDFDLPYQALVDAAFLAQGLLRAPTQLWGNFDAQTKERMITELKRSRAIKPWNNNWLLFASEVEAALLEFTGECDEERMLYGVKKFRDEWYKGDALYGDGPSFHQDYYNSFVIHPMLTDVLLVMKKHNMKDADFLATQQQRLTRYAEELERMISPEGTFPVVGRSIPYRFGAFHALAQASLLHMLPKEFNPAQVRSAMTSVIKRMMQSPSMFDKNGWLTVGFYGSQLRLAESYLNTGSAYLCSSGLLALGLPPTDPFWNAPFSEWSNLKVWNGIEIPIDHAIK